MPICGRNHGQENTCACVLRRGYGGQGLSSDTCLEEVSDDLEECQIEGVWPCDVSKNQNGHPDRHSKEHNHAPVVSGTLYTVIARRREALTVRLSGHTAQPLRSTPARIVHKASSRRRWLGSDHSHLACRTQRDTRRPVLHLERGSTDTSATSSACLYRIRPCIRSNHRHS